MEKMNWQKIVQEIEFWYTTATHGSSARSATIEITNCLSVLRANWSRLTFEEWMLIREALQRIKTLEHSPYFNLEREFNTLIDAN